MPQSAEGKRVPNVKFKFREGDKLVERTTDDLFKGKTVIVFGLPGAFTPTCSTAHVPRYNELRSVFKVNGVDDILCVSVNDPFVMAAWQDDQGAKDITFVPDGNGEFTKGVGMLVDKSDLCFGPRSWRYSMLVRDGVIEKMFVEPDEPGDPYKVSDADTMLKHIAPKAAEPEHVMMFTKAGCPHCDRAKKLLDDRGIRYETVQLGDGLSSWGMRAATGASTTPQVFFNGQLIGGADQLTEYLRRREAA